MSSRRKRYREIVETLSVHGFGFTVGAVGLQGRLFFRRGLPGHQQGRTYTQPEHLRLALEELGPTFVKLGQLLSTRSDLLPAEYTAELAKLQDDTAAVPTKMIVETLTEELGNVGVFDRFDHEPLASASIGQAHSASLVGTEVVVKVRRPGAVETVRADLEVLQNLAVTATRHSEVARGHDVVGIVQDFSTTLLAELDYLAEAHNAERFAASFADDPLVQIPTVFWETTTSRVLTLERVHGMKIDDVAALDTAGIDRRELAARATGVLCQMVFEDGFFHADPHPGNFFVAPDGGLAVIDFGMVGELDDDLRERLVALLVPLLRGDLDRTTQAMLDLVGDPPGVDRTALRDGLRPLVERFSGVPLADLALTGLITDVLALVRHHQLRLPTDLALLFKMLLMAEGLGRRLDPEFQLSTVVAPYAECLALRRHSADALVERIIQVTRDLLDAGAQTPRSLRGLAEVLERGGFDVHLRTADLHQVIREADRIGNRVIAGVIAAALIDGVGHIVAASTGRGKPLQGPLVVAGAGALGVLGAYLARNSKRTLGTERYRAPAPRWTQRRGPSQS
ncbi:ABC1 kinase family protein [Ornithinimicrobium sufpigmenti]|uniref:ABC1 kinase family protein n=1 Tax=Ornithinimicrobium sufpigmenti TaxID=2508882 RepID=UPI0010355ABE|nr:MULTISPECIES: AarF/ABC1/UbiB kinase family protein [unclassified Ornithinimicrobium]